MISIMSKRIKSYALDGRPGSSLCSFHSMPCIYRLVYTALLHLYIYIGEWEGWDVTITIVFVQPRVFHFRHSDEYNCTGCDELKGIFYNATITQFINGNNKALHGYWVTYVLTAPQLAGLVVYQIIRSNYILFTFFFVGRWVLSSLFLWRWEYLFD